MNFEPTEDYNKLISDGSGHNIGAENGPTPVSDQFVKLYFGKIDDPVWRKKHRSPLAGYIYIARQVIRKPGKHDPLDLYNRYFLDNKIAAFVPVRKLQKAFGYNTTSVVRRWIKQLNEEGAFIIDQINVGQPEPANIYIIGEFQATKEVWYYK